MGGGSGSFGVLLDRAVSLANRISGLLFPGVQGWWVALLGAVAFLVLVLGVRRLSGRSWTPILTAGLLTGMLWLWPYQELRLTMPLIPVLGMILIAGVMDASETVVRGKPFEGARLHPATLALGIAGLGWIVGLGVASVISLSAERHVEPLRVRELMLARAVGAVNERVPPSGVVGAPELWSGLALHTGRNVAPSARFKLDGNGPVWGTPSEQFAVWSAAEIEYVVLENAGVVHLEALDELDALCPGAVELQASWAGGMLVRLGWDEACRSRVVSGV